MLLRALAYKVHPYRWATIGLTHGPYRPSDAGRGAGLLPRPLPPFERHSFDLGRHRRREDARSGRKVVRAARQPACGPGPHPSGTGPDRTAPRGRRARRPRHDGFAGLPHGRTHLARLLHRRPRVGPAGRRRLGAALHPSGQGAAAALVGERLHFGRRRSRTLRLHGPAPAGDDTRTGRSGLPRRNRSAANRIRGLRRITRSRRSKTSSKPTRSSAN